MRETRRTAMQLLAASTLAMPFASLAARRYEDRVEPIGLQLYTVRALLENAFDRTLDRVDWRRIFALHRTAGIRHYFVEHDSPADPVASSEASYRYLRRLRVAR